jgi:putative acetyltransferase
MHVRPFQPEDAGRLALIFYRSVREGGLKAYTQQQVEAWAPETPEPDIYIRRGGDGRSLLVAVDGKDEPVAYIDLEANGHIDHLFCIPEFIGSGAASMLYDQLERIARMQAMPRLFVEASEVARPFFERKGFRALHRNDIVRRGVGLHNYTMEKLLTADAGA